MLILNILIEPLWTYLDVKCYGSWKERRTRIFQNILEKYMEFKIFILFKPRN